MNADHVVQRFSCAQPGYFIIQKHLSKTTPVRPHIIRKLYYFSVMPAETAEGFGVRSGERDANL